MNCPMPQPQHYSSGFVNVGGHRAVAEALNEGQAGALRRVVDRFVGGSAPRVIPLHVYAERDAAKRWRVTSLRSPEEWEANLRAMVRKRTLREALLRHGGDEVERAHRALQRQAADPTPLVVRLVIVLGDESSHVNAIVVQGGDVEVELFEPKLLSEDTPSRPFGTVRAEVAAGLCAAHGMRLSAAPSLPFALQVDDDLCQTWVAMYVVERLRTPAARFDDVLRRLGPATSQCDRLCAVLRFAQRVYAEVPFPRATRRGTIIETLSKRRRTTSRHFRADPTPCGSGRA